MSYKETLSGIYTITHVSSGRVYVGSAINIYQRWSSHRSSFNKENGKGTPYLRQVWRKHGADAFRFDIVELVDDKSRLIEREQYWINYYGSANRDKGFNIAPKAGSLLGIKQSQEAINKRVEKIRGQKRSDEFKRKASAWMQGNKNGAGHSWCGHLRESDILPIFQAVADGSHVEDVASTFDVSAASIRRVIKRRTWDHVVVPTHIVKKAQTNYDNRRKQTNRSDPRITRLTPFDVASIKTRLLAGENGAAIAREYGVTDGNIYSIKQGRIWKDIKPSLLPQSRHSRS